MSGPPIPPPAPPNVPPGPHRGGVRQPPGAASPSGSTSRTLMILALGCGGLVAVISISGLAFLVWFGSTAPDTAIIPGPQVPQRFMDTVRGTGVLDDGETVLYFYSDAVLDITEGFYLLTDRKVVLYSTLWEEPEILIPFDEIVDLDVEYNKSFFEDSMIYLELRDGSSVGVPASSDYDRDELFFETLEEKWLEATGANEEM